MKSNSANKEVQPVGFLKNICGIKMPIFYIAKDFSNLQAILGTGYTAFTDCYHRRRLEVTHDRGGQQHRQVDMQVLPCNPQTSVPSVF